MELVRQERHSMLHISVLGILLTFAEKRMSNYNFQKFAEVKLTDIETVIMFLFIFV